MNHRSTPDSTWPEVSHHGGRRLLLALISYCWAASVCVAAAAALVGSDLTLEALALGF